ncbi:YerC/YecD family TrpR-related protein [Thioalkalivibrio sp. XN279]|uniref:YerC/YecD family TrpR-related protein n=1 Tax=Thioalkalivibrio sp. XN279 TaxID=2714953 RepID=UPI00140C4DEC|nr:YerC/YecD family TrpR-related protein [Thioalkalivibrio sp. XN279]NHA14921.1 DNA-binding transcriptional regulator [Thioalkalivibrio sp. XN279]
MKNRVAPSKSEEQLAEAALCRALLALRTAEEARAFLRDLCTPAELQALVDRWRVVGLLRQGMTYRQINEQTGISVTTIGRVARFLADGNGGYLVVADRLDGENS